MYVVPQTLTSVTALKHCCHDVAAVHLLHFNVLMSRDVTYYRSSHDYRFSILTSCGCYLYDLKNSSLYILLACFFVTPHLVLASFTLRGFVCFLLSTLYMCHLCMVACMSQTVVLSAMHRFDILSYAYPATNEWARGYILLLLVLVLCTYAGAQDYWEGNSSGAYFGISRTWIL